MYEIVSGNSELSAGRYGDTVCLVCCVYKLDVFGWRRNFSDVLNAFVDVISHRFFHSIDVVLIEQFLRLNDSMTVKRA